MDIFYSKDGRKGYLIDDKKILKYSLPVPFSRDFYNATYIGKQKLIKAKGK